jgi:hypothetical protein
MGTILGSSKADGLSLTVRNTGTQKKSRHSSTPVPCARNSSGHSSISFTRNRVIPDTIRRHPVLADLSRGNTGSERPEHRLLLFCGLADLHSDAKERVHDLLRQKIDWIYFLGIAQMQGVLPVVYHSLLTLGSELVPPEFLETLQMRYLTNATRNLVLARRLLEIVDILDSHGVACVPIKGPVLAVCAYGRLSFRQFSDLDILVHRRDALNAKHLLHSLGYVNNFGLTAEAEEALFRYQKDFQLISPVHKTVVELHWALEPGKRFQRFSDETVWKHLTVAHLEGRAVPNLSPEDSLLYLCLHGANHRWDRLCWICDVARTIARHEDLDWESTEEQARKLHSRRALFLGLALAKNLLDAPVPHNLAQTAERYSGVRRLAELVAKRLFCPPSTLSGLRRSFSFHMMVSESLLDKIQLCGRRILLPDAVDFQQSRLPARLYFLLPLLRPIRLFREHLPSCLVPASWQR